MFWFFLQAGGSEEPNDERKPLLSEEVRENKVLRSPVAPICESFFHLMAKSNYIKTNPLLFEIVCLRIELKAEIMGKVCVQPISFLPLNL